MPGVDARSQQLIRCIPASAVIVDGDSARLSQVVANLLDNAAKFTPAGGTIELVVRIEGDEAVLEVTDSGRGIDPAFASNLFRPFQQADLGAQRHDGGLGLGLSLAKAVVELHGGSLVAESEGPGRGSTFTVRLPLVFSDRTEVPQGGPWSSANEGEPSRILVVDDNADAAATTASLLDLLGYTTSIAHDGPSALTELARFDPDVVLLDIGLPGLDGYAVARLMRAQTKRPIVLIALTGWGQEDDRRRSREAGFDDHLVKPVDPDALLAAIAASRTKR